MHLHGKGSRGIKWYRGEAKRCDKCKDTTTSSTCALKNRPMRGDCTPGQGTADQSQCRRRSAFVRRNEEPGKLTALLASLRKFLACPLALRRFLSCIPISCSPCSCVYAWERKYLAYLLFCFGQGNSAPHLLDSIISSLIMLRDEERRVNCTWVLFCWCASPWCTWRNGLSIAAFRHIPAHWFTRVSSRDSSEAPASYNWRHAASALRRFRRPRKNDSPSESDASPLFCYHHASETVKPARRHGAVFQEEVSPNNLRAADRNLEFI